MEVLHRSRIDCGSFLGFLRNTPESEAQFETDDEYFRHPGGIGIAIRPDGRVPVGTMHFTPDYKVNPDPKRLTENLLAGIEGLHAFFEAIDAGLPQPETLHGYTNKGLATLAGRLGFTVTEAKSDGSLYRIIGETSSIRENFTTFTEETDRQGKNIVDRLRERLAQK